jgi:CelD/BcsL family acetyltransferase involved in cellulose biosynthesis
MSSCGASNELRFELIETAERLSAIAGSWNALWSCTHAGAFQSHGWISAWWANLGSIRSQLLIAVAWERGEAVAILPLAIERRLGARVLVWAGEAVSDYCDALAADGPTGHQALAGLWAKVRDHCGADLVTLKQVRPDAKIRPLLTAPCSGRNGLTVREEGEFSMQVVNHWPNGDAYFRSLNKKARNNHTRGKRILAESGRLTSRLVGNDEIGPVLDRLFELKARWVADTGSDWPLLANRAAGLRSFGEALASIDRLAVFVLEVDDVVIAGTLNILDRPKMLAFVAAYDPAYERASPGTILMVDYAMWAFDAGFREIDYLRGEQPYKLRFANARTYLSGYQGGQTAKGKVLYTFYRAKKRLDRFRSSAKPETVLKPWSSSGVGPDRVESTMG